MVGCSVGTDGDGDPAFGGFCTSDGTDFSGGIWFLVAVAGVVAGVAAGEAAGVAAGIVAGVVAGAVVGAVERPGRKSGACEKRVAAMAKDGPRRAGTEYPTT